MAKRFRRKRAEQDLLGLAGWMYADLFLALMVIFLATISFIPKIPIPVQSTSSSNSKDAMQVPENALIKIYNSFDTNLINADISEYAQMNGVSIDSPISYIQIVGGYNENTETPDQGAMRALVFGLKLTSADPIRFSKIGANLDSSPKLLPSQVEVRLSFGR
jgi:hypothetical protein